ncbi:tetratricopeptide repeat protein [Polymorphobacter sp.]|uniref:tetratricopeptide repeat protein n=1 Tax=Polymorphobacter sp. TaxID=1909290 RepID=UPI003F7078C8
MTDLIRPKTKTATARLMAAALALPLMMALPAMPAAAAVSAAVGKALNAAQSAAKAGRSAAAIEAVNQARAAARTDEEKQKSAQMAAYVYTQAGRYADAATALQQVGASPSQLAPLYYRAGQYDRAIAEARKGGGEQMQILIAQALLRKGDNKGAVTAYNNLIKANGPKAIYLENLAGAQFKSGDKAGYLKTTERLVRSDGSSARWGALLSNFRQNPMRPEAKLAMFHLMQATGNLTRPEDYAEFAKLALVAGQAGVATNALAKANLPDDAMNKHLGEAAAKMATQATTEAPKMAASPNTAFRGGGAYMGMGQYDKAIAAYDKAIAAGGTRVDQARLFKGIAALKAGKVAAGKAALDSVGETGGMQDIAQLWALYASTKGAVPATA